MSARKLVPWIAAAITCVILVLLYRALRRYDPDQVIESLRQASAARLALAGMFTAGSYLALTMFDTLAVRYLGHALPYRKIALASFTSLSIGHNVGIAALSSGAIRYRFYTRWGLSGLEVAKLIAFCGITVGLGLATLGGLACLLRPKLAGEVMGLGMGVVYGIGVLCLAAPAAWVVLAMMVTRPICIRRWTVDVPGPRFALAQIGVGTLNFALVAAVLQQAVLTVTDVNYFTVATVYVISVATALASHVPGGLGVIEAVVMHLMPQADLLVSVIIFRAVYFLVPLPFGVTLFLASELFYRRRSSRADASFRAAGG